MSGWRRWAVRAGGLLGVALLLWLLFRPSAVRVETAAAERGPLRVTVDEEGRTRVRRRYVVSAPVPGLLAPCPVEEGDTVAAGGQVGRLFPLPLDPRTREQADATLRAAEASKRAADAQQERAQAALEEAERILARQERVAEAGGISPEALDEARTAVRTAAAELKVAESRARAAAFEVRNARAALMEAGAAGRDGGEGVPLLSPVDGRVLRVHEECERVVAAGQPILDVGDPSELEVVVEALTTDAVRVRPGTRMLLVEWGGADTLEARIRLVEPSAFTKVSALGIEEQRVNVIGDFLEPAPALGDGYRVEARIVLWEGDDVLQIPTSALFHRDAGWAVFGVEDGRARLRRVEVGHRNPLRAEILSGLGEGETVVLHPDDRLADGVRVEPLEEE